MIVVKAKIKDMVKDCSISSDFAEALDLKVREMIATAEKRAKANGRKTLMAKDL